jgi:hypothetical protein
MIHLCRGIGALLAPCQTLHDCVRSRHVLDILKLLDDSLPHERKLGPALLLGSPFEHSLSFRRKSQRNHPQQSSRKPRRVKSAPATQFAKPRQMKLQPILNVLRDADIERAIGTEKNVNEVPGRLNAPTMARV